jgi:hypothetical protein
MAPVAHKQPVSIGLGRRAGNAVWIAAVVALALAVVVVVLTLPGGGETNPPAELGIVPTTVNQADGVRYDGGPDEGTRGVTSAETAPVHPSLRYDGGPEEGTPFGGVRP